MSGRIPVAGVIVAIALAASGYAAFSSNRAAPPRSVEVAASCVSSSCLDGAEVEKLVGFAPLEPSWLPQGYMLYERSVPHSPLPEPVRQAIAAQRGVPLQEVEEFAEPTTVHLDYRFQGRSTLPAIQIIEAIDARVPYVLLDLAGPDCGERLTLGGSEAFHGAGAGVTRPSEELGRWSVCPADGDLEVINLVLAVDNVIIEIKAFPEAGVTREDIVKIAESLR